jgi:hypothetical protein
MNANHEAIKETECSATLRYVLVFLLVLCAFGVLLFGAVAAYSTPNLRHSMRTVLQPIRTSILREFPAEATSDADARETFGVSENNAPGAAAVVNQNLFMSTRYTVRVRLSGGAEQFILVTAPPGGLQLEVRDMTGDNIRNDLVLRPALIHWPLIVLLNDGHDHFRVAISATLPSSLDSGSHASRGRQIPETVALTSTSSKAGPKASSRQIPVPSLQQDFLSPLTQGVTNRTDHRSVLGRAPPAIATRIQLI